MIAISAVFPTSVYIPGEHLLCVAPVLLIPRASVESTKTTSQAKFPSCCRVNFRQTFLEKSQKIRGSVFSFIPSEVNKQTRSVWRSDQSQAKCCCCSLVETNVGHISCCLNMKTRKCPWRFSKLWQASYSCRKSRFNVSGGATVPDKCFETSQKKKLNPLSEPCSQTEKMIPVAAHCKHPRPRNYILL